MTESDHLDCLVIGAGIAGLLAARSMADAGWRVQVVEKSRGLGGRMATRRRDDAVFDHGAQFFTTRDGEFGNWVDQWQKAGLVDAWYDLGESGTHFRCKAGMTAIAKHLAEDLLVLRETQIVELDYNRERWRARDREGMVFRSNSILLTAPVPQSLELLSRSQIGLPDETLIALSSIEYHRCIAALAIRAEPSAITEVGGALKLDGGPIAWISDNLRKGISPDRPSLTIHSTPAFAAEHWESPDETRLPPLLEAASPHIAAEVVSCEGHRWRYSQPTSSYDKKAFVDAERRLAIAGDGFTGGRVEGAALSGLAAAQQLLEG